MSGVLCFGEALIDLRGERVGGAQRYIPQPGGAPANVAVGVARLGGHARFAGQVGADSFGRDIHKALTGYGVDTSYLVHADTALTALALVSLDEQGERSFSFYRQGTADLLYQPEQLPGEALAEAGIFHVCSNTLTEPGIRDTTRTLTERARAAGCLISMDVNYRAPLWPQPDAAPARIEQLAGQADLVKFSREELEALYGNAGDAVIQRLASQGVRLVVVSDGPGPLQVVAGDSAFWLTPPGVTAVDTTAAGDAFVAGLLFQLASAGVDATQFSRWLEAPANLSRALAFAMHCGAIATTRYGAFDALPTADDMAAFD